MLFCALEIFDPTQMPSSVGEWEEQCQFYGRDEIELLAERFGKPIHGDTHLHPALIRPAIFKNQWEVCKQHLWTAWMSYLDQEPAIMERAVSRNRESVSMAQERLRASFVDDTYKSLLLTNSFPEVLVIAGMWRVLFLSSVEPERGFSLMALIKTKLRNSLYTETLDALMQIAANGPPMSDHSAVDAVLNKAYVHWVAARKRNVRKSHPGVAGRPYKQHTTESAEVVLEAVSRERADAFADLPLAARMMRVTDSVEEAHLEVESGNNNGVAIIPTQEELYMGVGPFQPSLDFPSVLPSPELGWDPSKFMWRNRRLAHKFDDGWYLGSFQGKVTEGENKGKWEFFYQCSRERFAHVLATDQYGMDSIWVIVERSTSTLSKEMASSTCYEETTTSNATTNEANKEEDVLAHLCPY